MQFKEVTKPELDAFLASYPRKLVSDVATMGEPPIVSFNDFSDGNSWPKSIVAKTVLNEAGYPNADGTVKPNTHWVRVIRPE